MMNKKLVIFSVIMLALGLLFMWLNKVYDLKIASPSIPFIVVFFFCITLFTIYIVSNTKNQFGKKFIVDYMLSRVIKLSAIFLFLILYILLNKEDMWNFALAFLIIYFAYSIFEIVVLKKNNERPVS